ncbi:MAG: fumarate hydratase, partial [Clostridiales bacterium]|nr:fumarate hydratase [Clostridiales bacterium]
MREITACQIKDTIKTLFININYEIGDDVLSSLESAVDREVSPVGKAILGQIIENDIIAKNERVPMCQDTGMAVVFA